MYTSLLYMFMCPYIVIDVCILTYDVFSFFENTRIQHREESNLIRSSLVFSGRRNEAPLSMDNSYNFDHRITSFGFKHELINASLPQVMDDNKLILNHPQKFTQDHGKDEDKILVTNGHNSLPDHGKGENLLMVNERDNHILDHCSDG